MRQFNKAGVVAAVGVVALTISGCYTFVGLTISKSTTRPGTSSTVNVRNMALDNQAPENRTRYILFVSLPDNDTVTTADDVYNASQAKFDTTGVLYRRPKPLPANTAVRDYIVGNGFCVDDLDSDSTDRYVAFVSQGKVKTAAFQKQVTSRYVLRQAQLSPEGTPVQLLTAVGAWGDDGDSIPESTEIACWGGASHAIRPKAEPTARPSRAVIREHVIR